MSNIGFHKFMKDIGCEVRTTKVGDRYVLEDMLKTGSVIGGEQSGHIIFLNHTTTGDGILSSLQLLKAVLNSGKLPSQLSDSIEIFPQVLKNAVVKEENKNAFEEDEDIKRAVCEAERTLGEEGRILIRASGTEPLVRVMIEGKDLEKINEMANGLARLATEKLG